MPWLASLFAMLAALVWYLAAPQQRWLHAPLQRGWRYAGWTLAAASLVLWMVSLDSMSGVVSALTALMLGAVMLPYLAWWLRPTAARSRR